MTKLKHTLAVVAGIAAIGLAAGCGSDDDKKPATVAEAKAKLSKDCQSGKGTDKKLCDCVADKLQEGGSTAKQILDLNEQVKDGKVPTVVTKALTTCTAEVASAG